MVWCAGRVGGRRRPCSGLRGRETGGLDERGGLPRRGRGHGAHRQETDGRGNREAHQDRRHRLGLREGRWSTTTSVSRTHRRTTIGNAAKAFAKALALNALPQQQHEQLQFNLGQLYIVTGQHDEGIKTLQEYIASACTPPPPEAHIFLANALLEKKRFKEALPQIDLALAKAKEPKETWLQMKLAISYELKDYKACAEALVQLIGMAPTKPDYWKQLSSMFYEMKQDTEAVAVLALAERQGSSRSRTRARISTAST